MSELVANPKCNGCKCYFISEINIRSNLLYKSCEKCRTRDKEIRNKNKCEHNKRQSSCKDCGGSQICKHNKHQSSCKDCGGSQICEHNKQRSSCKDCGGSQICEHNKQRNKCKDCGGSSICEHNKRRNSCKDCLPILYLVNLQRSNISRIMKQTNIAKTKPSIEYLGCSAEYFKEYIQSKMTFEMNFDNIHYDHIKPVSKFNLEDEEELLKCCHYTNFQPLMSTDNLEKSNKWNEECEHFWNENICGKEYNQIYNPFALL